MWLSMWPFWRHSIVTSQSSNHLTGHLIVTSQWKSLRTGAMSGLWRSGNWLMTKVVFCLFQIICFSIDDDYPSLVNLYCSSLIDSFYVSLEWLKHYFIYFWLAMHYYMYNSILPQGKYWNLLISCYTCGVYWLIYSQTLIIWITRDHRITSTLKWSLSFQIMLKLCNFTWDQILTLS